MDEVNFETPNSSEFGSLELNNVKRLEFDETKENIDLDLRANKHGDGNDSGVDTGATNPIQLQRALSSNSSSGGLDTQFASCNSSLCSYIGSHSDDGKTTVLSTSENGSESSSLSSDKQQRFIQATPKKRTGLSEASNKSKPSRSSDRSLSTGKNVVRAASVNRVMNGAPILATTERARSRDKQITTNSQSSPTKRLKPGSILPINSKDGTPVQEKSSTLRRAASMSRRTPSSTPTTEDGRWPFNQFRSTTKVQNRNLNESLVIKTKVGHIVLESQTQVKSEEDLSEWQSNRNSSTTRDRMSSSTIVRRLSTRESSNKGVPSFPPRHQKPTSKTLIYHEAAIQTALTSNDIENAFGGHRPKEVQIGSIIKVHREIQADMRDKVIEQLEEKLRSMDADNKRLRQNLLERSQLLTSIESQLSREREEKMAMKKEMQSKTERVLGMLELIHVAPTTETETSCDSLLMLESQIQLSGHALEEKQAELNTLRQFCNQLQIEMNRSIQVQQNLLEEKKCLEKESNELHDFLQDEKTAIFEALKDAEIEIEGYEEKLKQKELKMERLEDECRHLVRISEQRRQEFLGLKTQYTALESKIKNLVVQDSQVSGATHALFDLGSRLYDLVDQLVNSYNISEQELEDIFQQEAYSEESSPENESNPIIVNRFPSPHKFITAVVEAIKNASFAAKYKVTHRASANGTEMLDSETEPCLMMENVLEDVSLPDSHTQNLVSSTVLPSIYSLGDNHDDSLQLLCEAITKRQKIEEQATLHMNVSMHSHNEKDISDMEKIITSSNCEQLLLDNVISVDNLVTKLLKVLRIIQINNDKFIQHLINEKNTLQLNKEETKGDLEFENSILESRHVINKLNEDMDSLSILCSSNINHSNTVYKDEQSKKMPIISDNGISIKKDLDDTKLNGLGLNLNTRSCAIENKSQNDTIVKAIETLNGIHSIVRQYPALIDLQRDLVQMLPSDCNANSQFE